jgi:hypothetical protein
MSKNIPKATHSGTLKIGDIDFRCVVLEDGTRVITGTGFMKALGMYRSGALSTRRKDHPDSAQTPLFLAYKNLKPFISDELSEVLRTPIEYLPCKGKQTQKGIKAEAIPKICDVWLRARDAGILKGTQMVIAVKCDILIRALAHVGIIALVDEATGYQYDRDRYELFKILDAYIAKELLPWAKRFPDEYYRELFRLRGWQYSPMSVARPQYVGKLTNQLIYDRLPPGVKEELQRKNPITDKKLRKHRHHQFLTLDLGVPHLDKLLAVTVAFMKASPNWAKFMRLFNRAVPKPGAQQELDFDEEY